MILVSLYSFFFNDTATTEIYTYWHTLSLHDALPISWLSPVTLQDDRVALVPLAHAHAADLTEAVKDGELWKLWYTAIPAPEKMTAEIDNRQIGRAHV